jgi:hypothetical protein
MTSVLIIRKKCGSRPRKKKPCGDRSRDELCSLKQRTPRINHHQLEEAGKDPSLVFGGREHGPAEALISDF